MGCITIFSVLNWLGWQGAGWVGRVLQYGWQGACGGIHWLAGCWWGYTIIQVAGPRRGQLGDGPDN